MSVDFGSLLTAEQKRQLIESRIAQFAAEGYQHSLNRQIAVEQGNEEGIASADGAMAILSVAIETHQAELDALPE